MQIGQNRRNNGNGERSRYCHWTRQTVKPDSNWEGYIRRRQDHRLYRFEVINRVSEFNEASGRSSNETERGLTEGHAGQGRRQGVQVGPHRRYAGRCPDEAESGSLYPQEGVKDRLLKTPMKIRREGEPDVTAHPRSL